MATQDEIKVGKIFRHKGGKLYKIEAGYPNRGAPRWGCAYDAEGKRLGDQVPANTVFATQWQINEKHPNGREYQAARKLKIADLTAID